MVAQTALRPSCVVLHAHIFGPDNWDEMPAAPAVTTSHQSEREADASYALDRRLAELGYVAISFEYPDFTAGRPMSPETIADGARHWLDEKSALLGIDPAHISVEGRGDSGTTPARFVLRLFPAGDSDDHSEIVVAPSTLILVWSPLLNELASTEESAAPVGNAAWAPDDITPGTRSVAMVVDENASREQTDFAAAIEMEIARAGNPFEIVNYESAQSLSVSAYALNRETAVLAESIHDVLRSLSIGSEKEG